MTERFEGCRSKLVDHSRDALDGVGGNPTPLKSLPAEEKAQVVAIPTPGSPGPRCPSAGVRLIQTPSTSGEVSTSTSLPSDRGSLITGVEGEPPTGAAGLTIEIVKDSDRRACQLADRHYSRKTKGANRIAGPGEHLILVDKGGTFVVGFRYQRFRKDGQTGVECFIFRNEGQALSSLILDRALPFVFQRWGHTRLFTYIAPQKIKSPNPGYCFKKAGWTLCGHNKIRRPHEYKIILEKAI